MLKRTFDLAAASAGAIILSPFLAGVAVAIVVESGLPIFYRGVRTGRSGTQFRIFKFRTMIPDAEKKGGGTTGLNDPRVTRIGRILRKYKLDELPQLFNVILGDMSIVGPRPELPMYTDWFQGEEKLILTVRPGITDFASIEFSNLDERVGSQDVDRVFEEKILPIKNQLRVKYVKEQSFVTDMKIILRTLLKITAKAGRSQGDSRNNGARLA